MMMAARLLALLLVLLSSSAKAVEPGEMLDDPALEARARTISAELRCLVCQNQSIDDSNADLARDLRVLVRERLKAGDSDAEIIDFVAARYGDFVLLDPPVKWKTAALWGGPAVVFALGIVGIVVWFRRRQGDAPDGTPLSAEEERRLRALLEDDGGGGRP